MTRLALEAPVPAPVPLAASDNDSAEFPQDVG